MKDKAKELINKYLRVKDTDCFYWDYYLDAGKYDAQIFNHAKECAAITVCTILDLDDLSSEGRAYWEKVLGYINIMTYNELIDTQSL